MLEFLFDGNLAIFGLLGTAISGGANAAIAKSDRDWKERMSNTAYQRMAADMKAANLNPLMGMKSGGASTPSHSSPSMDLDTSGAADDVAKLKDWKSQREIIQSNAKQSAAEASSAESQSKVNALEGAIADAKLKLINSGKAKASDFLETATDAIGSAASSAGSAVTNAAKATKEGLSSLGKKAIGPPPPRSQPRRERARGKATITPPKAPPPSRRSRRASRNSGRKF